MELKIVSSAAREKRKSSFNFSRNLGRIMYDLTCKAAFARDELEYLVEIFTVLKM